MCWERCAGGVCRQGKAARSHSQQEISRAAPVDHAELFNGSSCMKEGLARMPDMDGSGGCGGPPAAGGASSRGGPAAPGSTPSGFPLRMHECCYWSPASCSGSQKVDRAPRRACAPVAEAKTTARLLTVSLLPEARRRPARNPRYSRRPSLPAANPAWAAFPPEPFSLPTPRLAPAPTPRPHKRPATTPTRWVRCPWPRAAAAPTPTQPPAPSPGCPRSRLAGALRCSSARPRPRMQPIV